MANLFSESNYRSREQNDKVSLREWGISLARKLSVSASNLCDCTHLKWLKRHMCWNVLVTFRQLTDIARQISCTKCLRKNDLSSRQKKQSGKLRLQH